MNGLLARAQRLRVLHRHEDAVAMLMQHLAQFPDDPDAHVELALNRMRLPAGKLQALEDIDRAVGLQPGASYPLVVKSQILSELGRGLQALEVADRALALDPEVPEAWVVAGLAHLELGSWKPAEAAAKEALALDPDHDMASNLLAHALRLQNRLDESEDESRRRLARDPENPFSYANSGWAALQRGQVREAEELFLQALRFAPEMVAAREGLKEAYKARRGFYRLFLKWVFFLQRFHHRHRFFMMIALVMGVKVLRVLAAMIHPMLAVGLLLIYYILLFGTWVASGVANAILLWDPVARLGLTRREKWDGVVTVLLLACGLGMIVAGGVMHHMAFLLGGGTCLAVAIPLSMTIPNRSKKGQWVFGLLAVLIAWFGGRAALGAVGVSMEEFAHDRPAGMAMAVLLVMVTTWLGMVESLNRPATGELE